MNLLILLLLCAASAAAVWYYARHVSHLDDITRSARTYKKDHPAYLRPDNIPMIDLTRRLPSLKDSLSPGQKLRTENSKSTATATEDVVASIVLAGMGAVGVFITFGL